MASLWRRAMVYLGLQDDEELGYDADYDYAEAEGAEAGARDPRVVREHVPRDPRDPRDTRPPREPGGEPALVTRPVARDEARDVSDRRPSVIRTVTATSARVHVVKPEVFKDAQEVGDRLKAGQPVCLDLSGLQRDLARRLLDFSSGFVYALNAEIKRSTDHAFLLTPPGVEVTDDEKERLAARGLYRL